MTDPVPLTPFDPSAVNLDAIVNEWAAAHDVLTFAGVPVGPAQPPGVMWSLPARVRWLAENPSHALGGMEDLRRILRDYNRRLGQ